MQSFKRISRKIHRLQTHAVLAQQPVKIVHLSPYIVILILRLQDVLAFGRQVPRHTPKTLQTPVSPTITHRGFQRHMFPQFLIGAQRQTQMHALMIIHLQYMLYMADVNTCSRRDIARHGNRGKPCSGANQRQAV